MATLGANAHTDGQPVVRADLLSCRFYPAVKLRKIPPHLRVLLS